MMTEGFYTKEEAANILGVSERQINNYLASGKLRRIKRGRRVEIPIEDVDAFYTRQVQSLPPGRTEFVAIVRRLEQVESALEVLKLGLGHGSRKRVRGTTDLLLSRQRALDDMGKDGWSVKRISQVADELMSTQEEEVQTLCAEVGTNAWMPLCDLAQRMLYFVEQHPTFPGQGLDVLHQRLLNARARFHGMLFVASKVETVIGKRQAKAVQQHIEVPPSAMDLHVLHFIENVGRK